MNVLTVKELSTQSLSKYFTEIQEELLVREKQIWVGKIDGGPAFPASSDSDEGMSLRDYFAAKAMESILNKPNIYMDSVTITGMDRSDVDNRPSIAKSSYKMADAMVKESRK